MKKPTKNQPEIERIPVNLDEVKEKINKWNESIKENISEKYLKLQPKNGYVIVKMYKTFLNSSMFEQLGQGPTAKIERFENPYPYSTKAIVIAAERGYEPMTEVLVEVSALQLIGNIEVGKYPKYMFFTEDFEDEGYLIIPDHFIRVVL